MPTLLFVYGTLRRASGRPMARFLAVRSRYVGPATVAGRLYDLGEYPGIVPPRGGDDRVHGDLFELDECFETLAALDTYENVGQGLYERKLTEVSCGGEPRSAWVYWYLGEVQEARRIPGGIFSPLPARERGNEKAEP